MHDISIIIVSWNAKQYLVDCLKSIAQNQNGFLQEIIVVDNASTDGSAEILEKEYPDVKLIRNHENLGFAKANNIGIKASDGKYLALVNSDIIVLGDCIGKMIQFMERNPSVGMAGPRILNPDGSLQVSCRHFPSVWNNVCQVFGLNYVFPKSAFFSEPKMKYWPHDVERKVDVLSGCFWMIRREALGQVGLLDENFFFYGEDIDWCRRFNNAGWDIMFYPNAEAIHFGGASSSNAPIRFYLELQKADLQYWKKHHGRIGKITYAMIILMRHLLRLLFDLFKYIVFSGTRQSTLFKMKRSVACIRWVLFNGFTVT